MINDVNEGENIPTIKFAKVKESAIIPTKERENAGFDIYACWEGVSKSDKIIRPHQTKLIPTGIACALPIDYYFQIEERGSTGSKGIKRSAGVVDSGFRGEVFVAISNINDRYLIFGKEEDYLDEALEELKKWQNVDIDNLIEQDISDMAEFLKKQYGDDFEGLSDKDKIDVIKNTYKDIKGNDSATQLIHNITNAIFYPEDKAIAQFILHRVEDLPTETISYEDLKQIPSKRGTGVLGSSGK